MYHLNHLIAADAGRERIGVPRHSMRIRTGVYRTTAARFTQYLLARSP